MCPFNYLQKVQFDQITTITDQAAAMISRFRSAGSVQTDQEDRDQITNQKRALFLVLFLVDNL